MKKNIVFFFYPFYLLSVLTGCKESPQQSVSELAAETQVSYGLTEDEQILVRNGNDFSIKLLKKIAEEEGQKNIFVSTIGLFYSLNIINNSASGLTRQEICNALNIDTTKIDSINKFCRRLMLGQAKPSSNMLTATLFQTGKRVNIDPSFQKVLKHDYFASIIKGDVDSAQQQEIDKWCAKQTEGLLSSFPVKQNDDESANLFVASYFNGRWVQSFNKELTKKEPFKGGISSSVNMMNMTEYEEVFSYAKLDNFSMLSIPYVGGYRLYILLPDKIDGLASLLQSLDEEKLSSSMRQLKSYNHTYVKIPKFEVDYSFKANNYLTSLGVGKIFSDYAELNRIQSEPMKIREVIQKTKVIIDEDGTRAGAVTSSSFATLGEIMNPTEAYFYADHPFVYIIQDPFGNYCFMGIFWGDS
jgi:serpin B